VSKGLTLLDLPGDPLDHCDLGGCPSNIAGSSFLGCPLSWLSPCTPGLSLALGGWVGGAMFGLGMSDMGTPDSCFSMGQSPNILG
jgi:hypothetical protein